jgi:Holliday junction resolvasome RuvABC ATP-dependent DNA helicase subunit
MNTYTYELVSDDATTIGSEPLDKIIGQEEARKKLSFFVDSNSNSTPFPTMLFTGSQGLGKTFMAQKVSNALGREFIDVNCSTIETTEDFINGVLIEKVAGSTPKTILMDEAHTMTQEVTTNLLTLLNPNATNKNHIPYKNWLIEYDFARINIIFATTDAHKIFKPLLNRCEEIYFHIYSNAELFRILSFYLPGIKIACDKEDISYACRGRARDAFALSQKVQRYCNKEGVNVFNGNDWNNLKDIFSIYPCGLKTEEVSLLKIIGESEQISSANLAVRMGVNIQNIESELEIRPRELGFIESGARGRILTDKGKKYLKMAK